MTHVMSTFKKKTFDVDQAAWTPGINAVLGLDGRAATDTGGGLLRATAAAAPRRQARATAGAVVQKTVIAEQIAAAKWYVFTAATIAVETFY